jgi:ribosomal protein S18 acetylase RimI-like enzyme
MDCSHRINISTQSKTRPHRSAASGSRSIPRQQAAQVFIYDLFVAEPYRRKGIAEQAMLQLEKEDLRLGVGSLALHVFGYNTAARSLYERLGYETTNINMRKALNVGPG